MQYGTMYHRQNAELGKVGPENTEPYCGDLLALGNRLETISVADKTDRLARLRLEGSCSARAWLRVRVPNH